MINENSSERDYDFDLESALEYGRAEELQDNLGQEIIDPSQLGIVSEHRDGFEVLDSLIQDDYGDEMEDASEDSPDRVLDAPEPLETDSDLRPGEKWLEETTITDGRHVLDEFSEDVSTSVSRMAE